MKIERISEMTPIFSRRPADMEMRNEKEVITRMMNLGGEARRLTYKNRLDNGNDAENNPITRRKK